MNQLILSSPKFDTSPSSTETKIYIFPSMVKNILHIWTRYYNASNAENVDFEIFEESTQKKFIEGNTFAVTYGGWPIIQKVIPGGSYSIRVTNRNPTYALSKWAVFFKVEI